MALYSKVFCSETAVKVITDLMRMVGIGSYDQAATPLFTLLQDALALPVFDGGNNGVRWRRLHQIMMSPTYDPYAAGGIQ